MSESELGWHKIVMATVLTRRTQIARRLGFAWEPTPEWIEETAQAALAAFNAESGRESAKTAALDCLEDRFKIAEADPSMRAAA